MTRYSGLTPDLGKLPNELGKAASGFDELMDREEEFRTKLAELDGQSEKQPATSIKTFVTWLAVSMGQRMVLASSLVDLVEED